MENEIMKTVGVVIPIYNVEKYLKECLDSVINQTYTNLEIILVNDGSTDESSLNIAKEYTLKDKRITLFDKKNGGLSSARNVGIEYFSGEYKLNNRTQDIKENSLIEFDIEGRNSYEIHSVYKSCKAFKNKQELTNFTYPDIDYIIFLDSDDYWELNCIEECVPRMDGVEVVWFDYHIYYDDISCLKSHLTILEHHKYGFNCKESSTDFFKRMLKLNRDTFWFSVTGMIDFRYLKFIKLKFLDGIIHEDHYFGKLLFFQSSFIYVLVEKLYFYRIRKNSIMNYDSSGIYIPEYNRFIYEIFDKNYFLYRKYVTFSSKVLTMLMVLKFVQKNRYLDGISLFEKTFCLKSKKRRIGLIDFEDKYFIKAIFLIIKKFYAMSDNSTINLELIINFISDIIYINKNSTNTTIFQNRYGSAKSRIQNQLSYKLGQVLIFNSKNILGILFLPIYLISTVIVYKQEKKIYLKK
ncbi:Bglycosyltransferase, CAzY family GT2 [Campylobacter coli 76339]|nr:Bglycosyltransferase, CAzY family GT2 [Campylobacter coli 76339]